MANDLPSSPQDLDVTMMLAEAAQVADGKLNVLGGGVTVIPANPQPIALTMLIRLPWSRGDETIPWVLELLDADGLPVLAGEVPVLVNGQVRAGRPEGWPEEQPLQVPVAISFTALPVQPAQRYRWRLAVDGASDEAWTVSFAVAPQPVTA